jgi:hypothetical protein
VFRAIHFKDDANLIADLPVVEALIDRALELDEGFDGGAIHAFLIACETNRETATGDPEERARRHFKKAMEFSRGKLGILFPPCLPLILYAVVASTIGSEIPVKTMFLAGIGPGLLLVALTALWGIRVGPRNPPVNISVDIFVQNPYGGID